MGKLDVVLVELRKTTYHEILVWLHTQRSEFKKEAHQVVGSHEKNLLDFLDVSFLGEFIEDGIEFLKQLAECFYFIHRYHDDLGGR